MSEMIKGLEVRGEVSEIQGLVDRQAREAYQKRLSRPDDLPSPSSSYKRRKAPRCKGKFQDEPLISLQSGQSNGSTVGLTQPPS